eukprot:1059672-Karenia_brevis.AAC.1
MLQRPSLEQYKEKWDAAEALHARAVPGDFGPHNLAPQPVPRCWQDAPHVPFAQLKGRDAAARLSVTRPL